MIDNAAKKVEEEGGMYFLTCCPPPLPSLIPSSLGVITKK
jgi:hypothetical protein